MIFVKVSHIQSGYGLGFRIFCLLFFALANPALAGGLSSPFSLDSASVLPKGVRNVRVTNFSYELSQKFDSVGALNPLAAKFNKDVTWKELVAAQPAGFERESLQGYLESEGVQMSSVVGQAYGQAFAQITGAVPVVAYGLTEKLTVALAIPVVSSKLSVATGWQANQGFQAELNRQSAKGKAYKLEKSESKLTNVVAAKIAQAEYEPLTGAEQTEIGDVVLGMKYQALKTENLAWALSPRLVFPTGRVASPNKVVEIAPGDGQYDVGLSTVVEWAPISRVTLYSGAGYLAQLSAKKSKRIPLSADESLSPDLDDNVTEDLGDIVSASVGAKLKVLPIWSVGLQYTTQSKGADSHQGELYSAERYKYLGLDSDSSLETVQLGFSLSTIPLFQEKMFPIPLEASVGYTWPLKGKNVTKSNLAMVEIAAFF